MENDLDGKSMSSYQQSDISKTKNKDKKGKKDGED